MECIRLLNCIYRVCIYLITNEFLFRVIQLLSFNLNFKALRILRVMRPLRVIKASPSIRRQVSTLVNAIPEIANTTVFLFFVTFVFAVLGI